MNKRQWIKKIEREILQCNKCKRLREVTPYPMPHIAYTDIKDIKIFAIARNPGTEHDHSEISAKRFIEEYHSLWWQCRIGKYVRQHLSDSIVKNNILFTNVCKCSSPKNNKLTNEEIENRLPFLEEQLKCIRPQIICCFGSEAKQAIKKLSFSFDPEVYFFFHPSFFKYQKDKELENAQAERLKEIKEKI